MSKENKFVSAMMIQMGFGGVSSNAGNHRAVERCRLDRHPITCHHRLVCDPASVICDLARGQCTEAWIPLFMRCCIVSVILLAAMIVGSDWLRWHKEDRDVATMLGKAAVTNVERRGDRTWYSYNLAGVSGSVYRKDWAVPPMEILLAAAACGGAMIGVFSIAIGFGLVWMRGRNLGFALDVLPEAQPADDRDDSPQP